MLEPKPFASLTSGLLARKGGASPAMRRQPMLGGMSHVGHQPEDLGWNDMGEDTVRQTDPAAIGLTPMGGTATPPVVLPIAKETPVLEQALVPPVIEERRALEQKVAVQVPQPETVVEPVAKASAPRQMAAKTAFTLRLDPERHLRLRLACAVANRSAQQIVTDALDAYLASQPQIDALAEQLPRPGKNLKG